MPDYKAVMVVWHGNPTNKEYKNAITACLDFQKNTEKPILNFLADSRNQAIINPELRKWFENTALPKAVSQGLRRAAVVSDTSVFKKYHFDMIYSIASIYKLTMKHFDNLDDALKWFYSFD